MLERIFGKPLDGSQQSEDEKKLAQYIKSKVEEVRASGSRISHEGTWLTNAAYLLGFNSVYYDTQSKQYRFLGQAGQPLKKTKMSVNKILPLIQNRVAKLCKNSPRYDVRPNSSDVEDKDAATLSLKVINARMEAEHVNEKRIHLYMWLQQCGHAFVKVYWDALKGRDLFDPSTQETYPEGEICLDICSPFEVFVDPLAKTMDEAQWVIQAKVRKLDYFRSNFPERGSQVKEETAWLLSTQYELRLATLNTMGPTTSGIAQQMQNAAIELTLYEKPSSQFPKGRYAVSANGILLKDGPLQAKEIPFVKFDDVIVAGKFYSESLISHLRPLQDQYNRLKTKRAEWTNKLLAGKYLAPKGAGLIQEALNDQVGEVIEFESVPGQSEVKALNIPMIPEYAYREEETLEKDLSDISGINQVSKGQLPSASIPAYGIQLLLEQDDTRTGIVTEQHENAWARVGKLILEFASQYYTNERLLKEAGKNGEYQIKSFRGADIKGNTDVIVIRGSTLPGSKVLKRQEILNIYQQGLLGDPMDPKVREKVLGALEYGDIASVWEDFMTDESQIKRSIEAIEREEEPEFHELDNHTMHLSYKNRYRKSEKVLKLSEKSKLILNMDLEKHIQAQMRINNPQLAAQEKVDAESAQAKEQMLRDPSILERSSEINKVPMEGINEQGIIGSTEAEAAGNTNRNRIGEGSGF